MPECVECGSRNVSVEEYLNTGARRHVEYLVCADCGHEQELI